MVTFSITVHDPQGFHARTAGVLVKQALTCTSQVKLRKEEKTGNAKLIFHVMTLNAKVGETIEVMVSGEKEEEEAAALKVFYEENI